MRHELRQTGFQEAGINCLSPEPEVAGAALSQHHIEVGLRPQLWPQRNCFPQRRGGLVWFIMQGEGGGKKHVRIK